MSITKESEQEENGPLLLSEETDKVDVIKTKRPRFLRKDYDVSSYSVNFGFNSLIKKKRLFIVVFFIIIFVYINSTIAWYDHGVDRITVNHHSHVPGMKELYNNSLKMILPPGYLVWSDRCKMRNWNPYAADVMKFFKREKYEPCQSKDPLTRTTYDNVTKQYILEVDENLKDNFKKLGGNLNCCYEVIERSGSGKNADKKFKLSECMGLTKTVYLPTTSENILVKCTSRKSQTYINGHTMTPKRPDIIERLTEWKQNDTKRPLSILMIGIDSISRQNLIRAMPKTAQHLYDSEWFEMSGYNKVDDNTFPNFLAIFAGYNSTTAYKECAPTKVGYLDKCPLIWYDFKKYGYVTAYAEDESSINTFNYVKVGFETPPTDYYLRPFLLAAEKHLPIKHKSGLTFCLGYQHSAEYIYDYALEFAKVYRNESYFGLFWTNTFSHNAISDPSCMDDKMVEYLKQFESRGILNESMVIFFSDHGMRYGPSRKLPSGRIEEMLPFFFIWLPPWFKEDHPEFVDALNVNKNRLTNPYDTHMTLKHILEISGRAKELPQAKDCQNCQTLFRPVPQSRSCEDISIEDHWCTCVPYKPLNKNLPIVANITQFTIDYLNDYIINFQNGSIAHMCAKLKLKKIYHINQAMKLNINSSLITETFQFVFEVVPGGGIFEGTVRYDIETKTFQISGSISRLNSYARDSKCLPDTGVRKYCYCVKPQDSIAPP